MNDLDPIFSEGHQTQINDPQICQTRCNHQNAQTVWIGQMTFIEIKPTAFLIGEKGFNLKALFLPINCLIRQFEISDQ